MYKWIILYLALPSISFAASFDCKIAKTKIEILICRDLTLSTLDEQLGEAYKNAYQATKNKTLLKHEQLEWLKKRPDSACIDIECRKEIYSMYSNRISMLSAIAPPVVKNDKIACKNISISSDVSSLPDAVFPAKSCTLHQAIMLDKSDQLKNLVTAFLIEEISEKRRHLIKEILLAWTLQNGTEIFSRGENINAQHLGVLEYFWGPLIDDKGKLNISSQNIEKHYLDTELFIYSQLMRKTHYKEIWSTVKLTGEWRIARGDFTSTADKLVSLVMKNSPRAIEILTDFSDVVRGYWPYEIQTGNALYESFMPAISTSCAQFSIAKQDEILAIVRAFHDIIRGTPNNDLLNGYADWDIISGQGGNDILIGGNGDDYLYGDNDGYFSESIDGNDSLTGGRGHDKLAGGGGDDRYYFKIGDGIDYISDIDGNDEIHLGQGIKEEDIKIQIEDGSIFISYAGNDRIIIYEFFDENKNPTKRTIEKIYFNDGTVFGFEKIAKLMHPFENQ